MLLHVRQAFGRFGQALNREPARARSWAALITALVLASLITHGHFAGSGDAVHYMVIARSVAFDHDLDLSNNYGEAGSLLQVPPEGHVRPGRGGVLRPVHDIGLPVLAAPYFWGAYRIAQGSAHLPRALMRLASASPWITLRQAVSLGMIGVTTVLVLVFFQTARDLRIEGGAAFAGTLAWALSPPVLSHGYVFFTEIPSALMALAVFRELLRARDWTMARAGCVGALAGLLWLLHTRNIGLLVGLLLVACFRLGRWSAAAAAFVSGVLLLVLVKIAVNHAFWGTFFTTPLAQVGSWDGAWPATGEVLLRASGLLFDPNDGLLPVAPIYVLAPFGWWLLRRRDGTVARDVAVIVACYLVPVLLPFTNVQGWRGGWSPAARFLTPVVPFIGLGLPEALSVAWSSSVLVRMVCVVQFALSALFWAFPLTMWTYATAGPPFVEFVAGQVRADALPRWDTWSWHTGVLTAVLAVGWALFVLVLVRHGLAARQRGLRTDS